MKYTIDIDAGSQTKVWFPVNSVYGSILINRWDWYSSEVTTCETGFYYGQETYLCTETYRESNNYNIEITNSSDFSPNFIYLENAKVKNLINFNWFLWVKIIYLSNNNIENLPNNIFSNLTATPAIFLDYNNLWNFDFDWLSLSNIHTLSLRHNGLRTIPNWIWNSDTRKYFNIKITGEIIIPSTNSSDKLIDLSENNINFVWITKIDNTDYIRYIDGSLTYKFLGVPNSGYHFERFGYSYNTNNINYKYQILKENIPIDETVGTSNSAETNIPQILAPGNYTFKVCYNEENDNNNPEHCDEVNFAVDYDESITIKTPEANQEYNIQDNIIWERWRSWNYPEELLSWYEYIIEKWHIEIARWTISLNEIGSCYFQYENHEDCAELNINYLLWNDLEDWVYTLTVYLTDKNNEHIQTTDYRGSTIDVSSSVNFTINTPVQDPTIQITKPNNTETEAITHFSWASTIPDWNTFTNYTWEIKSGSTTVTGGTITNKNKTWFEIDDLDNWEYTFNVKLNYKRDNTDYVAIDTRYTNGTKSFTVEKTYPSIKINRPLNNETGATTYFRWTPTITPWFTFNNYEWTISKNGTTIITKQYTNIEQTSYETGWLNNWEYTFNIKMNYTQDSNNQSGYAIDRDYASNGGSKTFTISKPNTLNITSPANNWAVLTESENTFSRNWATSNTFIKYTYTLTWNDYSTWWSFDRINQNSFTLRNLRDGNYTLKVTMETNNGNETDIRTFRVNTSAWINLTITSPNKTRYTWNYIKTVPMNFTWNWWGSTLISRYTYKLTNTNTNQIIDEGFVNKNNAGSYSAPAQSLPSGTYRFEVTMLDSDDAPIIPTVSRIFNVVIPSYLEIHTPPEWQLNIKNVDFTWSGFAEFEDHYKYEINRVDNQGNIISTIESWNNVPLSTKSFSLQNLHNGKYTFTVSIMDGNDFEIISGSRTFRIPDDLDLILDISDWNSSETTLRSRKWIFSRWWKSEDFAGYSYSIQGTTFKNESYLYTWTSEWITTGSITLNNLSTWKYRFYVKMLNASGWIITWKYIDFDVVIPATLKIISPVSWSTVNSSNVTFKWDWYSDVITRYEYSLISSWWYNYNWFTTVDSFTRNDLVNWDYTLVVRLASGANFVAEDTIHFTVDIPKKTSWGGWWSSSKSHPTNDLSVSIANESPNTNERIEVKVDVKDKYTWKVDFSKMQYYSGWEWIDIPVTSKNYVSDYWDDAKLWYVNFSSSDNWEKELSEFLKISKKGNYRIYAEDKDWYIDYVQFYVWNWWNNAVRTTTARVDSKPTDTEDEVYIARSCKKYKITYSDSLNVYTSPNLNMSEYFMNKDYFKRYVDSKNRYQNWCPTNVWWISTNYTDKTNDNSRYTAPNGKVYFITWKEWSYYSNELNKELKTPTSFSTIQQLKYYIRDRNPLINMATLWPVK